MGGGEDLGRLTHGNCSGVNQAFESSNRSWRSGRLGQPPSLQLIDNPGFAGIAGNVSALPRFSRSPWLCLESSSPFPAHNENP
jgi:hypothetical protein